MKNKRHRPFQYFLKCLSDTLTDNDSKEFIKVKDQTQEQVQDGIGFNAIFLNILSFLDEYDLAQTIEPACKLFHSFASCDVLWKRLYDRTVDELCQTLYERYSISKNKEKNFQSINNYVLQRPSFKQVLTDRFVSEWKVKLVDFVRKYHEKSSVRNYSPFDIEEFKKGNDRRKRYSVCKGCTEEFNEGEHVFFNRGKRFHFDCLNVAAVKWRAAHLYELPIGWDVVPRQELIKFFGNRLIGKAKKLKEKVDNVDDDNDTVEGEEEELIEVEFVCDHCGDNILEIRYHCLDCDYDLCGTCCEQFLIEQKMKKNTENVDLEYLSLRAMNKKEEEIKHDESHTFVEVDSENFDTFSCNMCKDKIRGYRYKDTTLNDNDYDLCEWCFLTNYKKFLNEKKGDSSRFCKYDLDHSNLSYSLYEQFCNKLHVKELRKILEDGEGFEIEKGVSKKDLIELFLNNVKEKREEGKAISGINSLLSNIPRLCARNCKGNILAKDDFDVLIDSIDVVNESKKKGPPKKKVKQDESN
ncbi:hypothetical protein ABK040_013135 [Willaertia magna]